MASLSAGISSGEFSIGTLISSALSVTGKGFVKFIALAAIGTVPSLVLALIQLGSGGVAVGTSPSSFMAIAGPLIALVLSFVITGAIVFGAFNEMRGRDFSIGEALLKGLARFLPLLGASIISGILVMLGLVLLVVPGLIALCVLYVVTPACVVEHNGVFASVRRSAELTKGYRWKIFGLLVAVGIVGFILSFAASAGGMLIGGLLLRQFLVLVVQTVLSAYNGVLVALVYYNLRALKEGIDIDRIAEVFA